MSGMSVLDMSRVVFLVEKSTEQILCSLCTLRMPEAHFSVDFQKGERVASADSGSSRQKILAKPPREPKRRPCPLLCIWLGPQQSFPPLWSTLI
jgi:hypothetical protein